MNVTITSPFWKRRRDQIVESVIPYQWGVMNDEIDTTVPDDPAGNQLADNKSHAVANLKVAAGELDDEFHGMVFQDSDCWARAMRSTVRSHSALSSGSGWYANA